MRVLHAQPSLRHPLEDAWSGCCKYNQWHIDAELMIMLVTVSQLTDVRLILRYNGD
jgi:hypothetical protein